MKKIMTMIALALCTAALYGGDAERLKELERICAFIPSDNLDAAVPEPTPDEVIVKYHVTTNVVVEDLKEIVRRSNIAETNFMRKFQDKALSPL